MRTNTPTPERIFNNQLAKKILIGDGCWEWTGTRSELGYGRISIAHRSYPAHRVVYEWLKGPIPEGLELDHLCRNPPCVNPKHLEPVTHAENMKRGKRGLLTTHCPRGHEYTEGNIYRQPSRPGSRLCRACREISNHTYVRKTPRKRGK